MQAALLTDGYKTFHGSAIHKDISRMYGNFTNRSGRLSNLPDDQLGGVVSLGLQHFCMDTLCKEWNRTFFRLNIEVAVKRIKRILDAFLEDGSVVDVCKNPKTDSSKKSAKGLLYLRGGEKIVQMDQVSVADEQVGLLQPVFCDGDMVKFTTLKEIREVVAKQLNKLV